MSKVVHLRIYVSMYKLGSWLDIVRRKPHNTLLEVRSFLKEKLCVRNSPMVQTLTRVAALCPLVVFVPCTQYCCTAGGISRILHQARAAGAAEDGVFLHAFQGESPPAEPPAPISGGGRQSLADVVDLA